MSRLAMVVPSRGRPESVHKQAEAWQATRAVGQADLVWAIDADDSTFLEYERAIASYPWMAWSVRPEWEPMVTKLNTVAVGYATYKGEGAGWDMVGFMGDDHLPRTENWFGILIQAQRWYGSGIFYGRDGLQDIRLPTWWAMSSDVIRELGSMVPSAVDHLYCDNTVEALGRAARALFFLPSLLIEHMHPAADKAEWDEGYKRVNRPEQYEQDRLAFLRWLAAGRATDAAKIRGLRGLTG